jgi:hypothetical protein
MENIPVNVNNTPTRNESDSSEKGFKKRISRGPKRVIGIIIGLVLIGALGFGAWYYEQNTTVGAQIDKGKYQALFLTNGQVYFGKLDLLSGDYYKLTSIFYLQTSSANSTSSQNPQDTSKNSTDVKLIKLGSEVHGPQDEMVVGKDQVLFLENLKSDGKVAQSISQYQAKK